MPAQEEYIKIITELVQKHMVVLGPNIALDKAGEVAGLSVYEDGSVAELTGDGAMVLKSLIHEYSSLCGQVCSMVISNILHKYPSVKIG